MTALTLTLARDAGMPLDLGVLRPDVLAGMAPDEIGKLPLSNHRRPHRVRDVFSIESGDGDEVVLSGIRANCHQIGRDMQSGILHVRGDAGDQTGQGMRGGLLRIRGSAGSALGCGMTGGRIEVGGDVGDRVGAPLPGQTRGMNDGTIIIRGSAGDGVGERMRRGLIAIGGDSGARTGDRMIAGTIIVLGACGADPGAGMRRGTLMLGSLASRPPGTFAANGTYAPGFLQLLADHVADFDRALARRLRAFVTTRRWCGDMAYGGKGEILLAGAAD